MRQITLRQRRILDFIQDRMAHHGMPPTRAEICAALGFRSPNAAEQHLRALARKGAIELLPGTSRGIRLPHKGTLQPAQDRMPDPRTPTCYGLTPVQDRMPGPAGLPLVGRVAAGSPILSEEHIEQRLPLDPRLFQPRADYLLRVQGLSMRDAGILDGDLLAVHRTTEVKEGQVVVARLDDEVTVKRFHRRGSRVTLAPANPDFDPIEVDLTRQQFTIEGRGVGLLRNGERL